MDNARQSSIEEWFGGKTLQELDIIEHEGRQLYPDTLKKKNIKKGELEEVPIYLRVPNTTEQAKARVDALDWVRDIRKLKEPIRTVDEARGLVGDLLFEDLDTISLMSWCILERNEGHARYMLPQLLDAANSKASLYELFDRLDFFSRAEDPRVGNISEDLFWAAVVNIAKARNLSPLVAIAGSERDSFILSMASRLANSRTPKSSSLLSETSMPAV